MSRTEQMREALEELLDECEQGIATSPLTRAKARAALTAPAAEVRNHGPLQETDLYDFAGWLTTRRGVMTVGASCEAGPMAEAVGEYIKTFPERFAPAHAAEVPEAMKVVTAALLNDPDYAWSWHCNIAMAAHDEGLSHYAANKAAARFLSMLAPGLDTSKHPGFPAEHVASEVPEAMGDAEIDRLLPEPDGTAEANATRVELAPGVWGSEYEEVDAWSRPLIRQFTNAIIAARDAQWQSTRLRGGVPEGWSITRKDDGRIVVKAPNGDAWAWANEHSTGTSNDFVYAFLSALTAAPQAPAPALDAGVHWFTVAEHGMPDVGEEVIGGLWYTDPWLKPEVATRFMWGLCRVFQSTHLDCKDGKAWQTFGPAHNDITHWARLNKPAMSAQGGGK